MKEIKAVVGTNSWGTQFSIDDIDLVMPRGEDGFYEKGIKGFGMYILYMIMAKTYLGQMCIADHSKNGIDELIYLYNKFDEFRKEHPGYSMPTWDGMRKYLP